MSLPGSPHAPLFFLLPGPKPTFELAQVSNRSVLPDPPTSICGMAVNSRKTINSQMGLDTVNMDERREGRGELILSKDLSLTVNLGFITNSYRLCKHGSSCYRSNLRTLCKGSGITGVIPPHIPQTRRK